jgi:predicted ATPase
VLGAAWLMYVSLIDIQNYRRFHHLRCIFSPGLNVIAGQNDCGKSAILRTLADLLDNTAETHLDHRVVDYPNNRDFHRCSEERPSVQKLSRAVLLSGTSFPTRKLDIDIEVRDCRVPGNVLVLPECNNDIPGLHKIDASRLGRQSWGVWFIERQQLDGASTFCAFFQSFDKQWKHCHDINLGMRLGLVSQFVWACHVPAIRHGDFVKSVVLKLLNEQLSHAIEWNGDAEQRRSACDKALKEVQERLSGCFASVTVDLSISGFDFSHSTVSFEEQHVRIAFKDDIRTDFQDKGSGTQNLMLIDGLLWSRLPASLFLIDEPENSLHPQRQRALVADLVKFGNSRGGREHQIIVSTHSPMFVQLAGPQSTKLLRVRGCTSAALSTDMARWTNKEQLRLRQVLQKTYPEMLFSKHVVLVEGGEEFLISTLCDVHFSEVGWLAKRGITVVRANGKGEFDLFCRMLDSLEIPHTLMVDLDFFEDELQKFLHRFDEDFGKRRSDVLAKIGMKRQQNNPIKESKLVASTKSNVFDWLSLQSIAKELVALQAHPESIGNKLHTFSEAWNRFESRIQSTIKIQRILKEDEQLRVAVHQLVDDARAGRIFMLKHGELEDYIRPRESHGFSKDIDALLCAIQIAETGDIRASLNHEDDLLELIKILDSGVDQPANSNPTHFAFKGPVFQSATFSFNQLFEKKPTPKAQTESSTGTTSTE